ncbi:MAG: outer membrane protein assembly factor BamE [Alphaproteobacteria bacterium]
MVPHPFVSNGLLAVGGRFLRVVAVVAVFSACSPIVDSRGNLPTQDLLSQIRVGVQAKDDVAALLGTASSISVFGDETWYYISSKEERYAFFRPVEIERKVVAILFDKRGIVSEIKTYGPEDRRDISLVDRKTPTAGTEMTVLQQILGNVGRFSKEKDKAPN